MILAVSGSPRKGGNTEQLLEAFLENAQGLFQVKLYRLQDMQLNGCRGCGACYKGGDCIIDDAIRSLYREVEKAEALVVSSPIYFANITSQLKAFIDRAQPFWARKYLLERETLTALKGGFFISAGGMEGDKYFHHASLVVKSFFTILNTRYSGDLFFSSIDEKGDIKKREGALDKAKEAGREFALSL